MQAKVSSVKGATFIDVTVEDAQGRPVTDLNATGRLVHPADARADHLVMLERKAPGQFRGTTSAAPGQWTLEVGLSRHGERLFRSRNRIYLY